MLSKKHLIRLASRAVAGLAAVAALASCGGGTYQVTAFTPARILTFGDESNMLISAQGLKYSINGVDPNTDVTDCSLLPLWNQVLATSYSLDYVNCNTQGLAEPGAINYATVGATVNDVANQVAAFEAGDSFNPNDLVTIWVGANDVLNDYQQNGSGDDQAALTGDMSAAGQQLAGIVNQIAQAGAKVILLTVPDLGLSPYAYTEDQRGDFDRGALLTAMTSAFNVSLRANVVNDGSKVGLVLPDDFVESAVKNPRGYGLIAQPNQTAGCNNLSPLPDCNQNDLVTDPGLNSNAPTIFLWADATHLGPTAQQNIGNQAVARAHSNPF